MQVRVLPATWSGMTLNIQRLFLKKIRKMSRGLNLFDDIVNNFIYINYDLLLSPFQIFLIFLKPLFSRSLIHF